MGDSCCHCLLAQLYLQQSKANLFVEPAASLQHNAFARYTKADVQLPALHKPAQHSTSAGQTSNSLVYWAQ